MSFSVFLLINDLKVRKVMTWNRSTAKILKVLLLMAVFFSFAFSASAEIEGELIINGGPVAILAYVERNSERSIFHIVFDSHQGFSEIQVFEPTVNGQFCTLGSHWNSDTIRLNENEPTEANIEVLYDFADILPEEVTFRFSIDGRISTPVLFTWEGDALSIHPASFLEKTDEDPLAVTLIQTPTDMKSYEFLFVDKLAEDDLLLLDDVLVFVNRIVSIDGSARLEELCTIKPEINVHDEIMARFSGLALRTQNEPDYLFPTFENSVENGIILVKPLTLYGNSIFYATLSILIGQEKNIASIDAYQIESSDINGRFQNIPRSLFSSIQLRARNWEMGTDGNMPDFEQNQMRVIKFDLTEPLIFELIPAKSIGKLKVFFQYYLSDGRIIVHEAAVEN